MPIEIADLFSALSAHEAVRANAPRPGEFDEEVIWLHTDVGPSFYLTRDGRVLVTDAFDPDAKPRLADPHARSAALVVGARNLAAPELLTLLPQRPNGAAECSRCGGSRWWRLPGAHQNRREPFSIVCPDCAGTGWTG